MKTENFKSVNLKTKTASYFTSEGWVFGEQQRTAIWDKQLMGTHRQVWRTEKYTSQRNGELGGLWLGKVHWSKLGAFGEGEETLFLLLGQCGTIHVQGALLGRSSRA